MHCILERIHKNPMDSSVSCAIGWSIHEKMDKLLHAVSGEIEEQYIWVEEVLAEAQKTMSRYAESITSKFCIYLYCTLEYTYIY